jgi:hypothetical protein
VAWAGVNSVAIEVPDTWAWFTGTGRVYAQSPDCRSGFIFTVWLVEKEESSTRLIRETQLTRFIAEYLFPCHTRHRSRRTSEYIQRRSELLAEFHSELVRRDPFMHGEHEGHATFWCTGAAVTPLETFFFGAVALHPPNHNRAFAPDLSVPIEFRQTSDNPAVMVMATSLDNSEMALRLAKDVAASCLRVPSPRPPAQAMPKLARGFPTSASGVRARHRSPR